MELPQFSQLKLIQPKALIILIIITLILSIFFRFNNLDQRVYSADEVRGLLRISGYTSQEFIEQFFDGNIVSTEELQRYQRPNSDKRLTDSIKAFAGNAEHPPLYYLMTRFWMQVFNHPIASRVLAILFGILLFPCLYWFCLELFEFPLTGWIAISLVAISPYQILISQTARQYTLWAVMIVLSSTALLKSLRVESQKNWIIYAATLALGFYSHLFFTFISIGHGIYVFIIEGWRLNKKIVSYLLASSLGILTFIPWILVITNNSEKINNNTRYYRQFNPSIQAIIQRLSSNLCNVFIDFLGKTRIEKYLDILILILVAYSLYFLCRYSPRKIWLFLFLLIVVPSLAIIIPDLLGSGIRSYQARYFVPGYLAIQLTVAYLISHCINLNSSNSWKRRFWQLVFLSLLSLGVISGVIISQTNDWDWDRGSASSINRQLAPVINKAEQPLVISEATHSFILALSYLVEPKVKFQLFKSNDVEQWKEKLDLTEATRKFSDVFLCYPDQEFLNFIGKDGTFQTQLVAASKNNKNKWLYKIVRGETSEKLVQ